ncbi:amino acid permease [Rhizorhabdus wittichii]|uniref:Amino acid permease n=1 Tax=Rhizorhabdus wittichii TaxID=160791 RepID=A0A975CZK5_9SPHN|nr:APC family permease [Rhizorhabdus wittichii]QTH20193.1 amino acid permease [Rhizorhabdus wittichii]
MSASQLRSSLGPFKLFAIAFGSIIGIGWITLVGIWLAAAGPFGSVLAFGLGCLSVCLIGLAYAELALLLPQAGGEVAYAHAAFGRPLAFVAGWALLMVYVAVIAFESISVGWVLGAIWPDLSAAWPVDTPMGPELLAGLVVGITVIWANIGGAHAAAAVQTVLTMVKIAACAIFIVAAMAFGEASNLAPHFGAAAAGGDLSGIATVFATSFLFYAGFNFLTQGIEERAPGVSVGQVVMAIIGSIVCAFLFYALIIVAVGMLLPVDRLAGLNLPAADAFEIALGSAALKNLVLGAGLVGLVTAWNGTLFGASRMLLSLARAGLVPTLFAGVSRRTGTPVAAILVISVLAMGVATLGKGAIGAIVGVAVTGVPLTWVVVTAAALKLRKSPAERAFTVPFGRAIFVAALLVSLAGTAIALHDVTISANHLGLTALGLWAGAGVLLWLFIGSRAAAKENL